MTCSLSIAFLAVLLPSGCGEAGPERASVSGQVTYDGQPVVNGTIAFTPTGETAGPVAGGPIENGAYHLAGDQGPVIGKHTVHIRASRPTGKTKPAVPPATGEVEVIEAYIPPRYNQDTTLSAEIQEGENQHDFQLKAD